MADSRVTPQAKRSMARSVRQRVRADEMRRALIRYSKAHDRQHRAAPNRANEYYKALQAFYDAEHLLRMLADRIAAEE